MLIEEYNEILRNVIVEVNNDLLDLVMTRDKSLDQSSTQVYLKGLYETLVSFASSHNSMTDEIASTFMPVAYGNLIENIDFTAKYGVNQAIKDFAKKYSEMM